MIQSKKHSLIESLTNVAIGYGVAVLSQILIFPFFGIHIPLSDNLMIGLWFTVISTIRSYVLRRWFTKRTENPIERMVDWINLRSDLQEESEEEPLLVMHGYEDCLMGISYRFGATPHTAYHLPSVLKKLEKDGMTPEEAQEWFDFNIVGSYNGDTTPCFIDTP